MKQLAVLQGLVLVVFVLLGNGLRAIATMTVSVSEGEFASFLNISVERTGVLIEVLIGGAVMALAVAPFLINPRSARRIAAFAALAAALCYGAIGLTIRINPELITRELIVISCFALGGFAVSFFAPLAQLAVSNVTEDKHRTHLITMWTAAQPLAFLVAPQLVKYVAFDIGTDNYFLILAAVPLVFLAIVPFIFGSAPRDVERMRTPVPWKLIAGFLFAVLAFEAWSTSNSFAGIQSPVSLLLLLLLIATVAVLVFRNRSGLGTASKLPTTAMFLLVLLFVLQIPTTGMYDTAYLVRHLCSSELITDRATLGAACQVVAVFAGGAALMRWPQLETLLIGLAILALLAGTVAVSFYPYQGSEVTLFYVSKAVSAFGIGLATSVIVSRVVGESQGNKVVMLAPAFVIMFGTEIGVELLEVIFQSAKLAGAGEVDAYQAVFLAQILAVLLSLTLLLDRLVVRLFARRAVQQQAPAVQKATVPVLGEPLRS